MANSADNSNNAGKEGPTKCAGNRAGNGGMTADLMGKSASRDSFSTGSQQSPLNLKPTIPFENPVATITPILDNV